MAIVSRRRSELMRESDGWVEPAIHIILVVCAVLALLGIVTVAHFVIKHW